MSNPVKLRELSVGKNLPSSTRAPGQKGQGLLEFALIVLLLVLLLFGAFDLGRIFHAKIVITNASREAARYLVLHPEDSLTNPGGFVETKDAAVNEAANSAVTLTRPDVAVDCNDLDSPKDGCDSEQTITVTINKTYSFFLSDMLGTTLLLSSYTQMYMP